MYSNVCVGVLVLDWVVGKVGGSSWTLGYSGYTENPGQRLLCTGDMG